MGILQYLIYFAIKLANFTDLKMFFSILSSCGDRFRSFFHNEDSVSKGNGLL